MDILYSNSRVDARGPPGAAESCHPQVLAMFKPFVDLSSPESRKVMLVRYDYHVEDLTGKMADFIHWFRLPAAVVKKYCQPIEQNQMQFVYALMETAGGIDPLFNERGPWKCVGCGKETTQFSHNTMMWDNHIFDPLCLPTCEKDSCFETAKEIGRRKCYQPEMQRIIHGTRIPNTQLPTVRNLKKSVKVEQNVYTVTHEGVASDLGANYILYDGTIADQGRDDLNLNYHFTLTVDNRTLELFSSGNKETSRKALEATTKTVDQYILNCGRHLCSECCRYRVATRIVHNPTWHHGRVIQDEYTVPVCDRDECWNTATTKMHRMLASQKVQKKLPSGVEKPKVATKCAQCGKSDREQSRCSRCKSVFYCNRECQRAHWPTHKKECQPTKVKPGVARHHDDIFGGKAVVPAVMYPKKK